MKILVGCEVSGAVRDRLRARGHEAWSCDILGPNDVDMSKQLYPQHHYLMDVRLLLDGPPFAPGERWDMGIFFPTCTYLCGSGLHWNARGRMVDGRPRSELTDEALDFVRLLMAAPIDKIMIENPTGCISTRTRKSDQTVQPYEFGDDASKKTCLWLKNLPKLVKDPKDRVPGRIVGVDKRGRPIERWANQTDSGQNKLAPSEDRAHIRSITYPGIAKAIAEQYG